MASACYSSQQQQSTFSLSVDRCDPGQMIKAALLTSDHIASEDVFVLWAMRLPLDIEAADAAALLLHAYDDLNNDGESQKRLRQLLNEASQYPSSHLDDFALQRKSALSN